MRVGIAWISNVWWCLLGAVVFAGQNNEWLTAGADSAVVAGAGPLEPRLSGD